MARLALFGRLAEAGWREPRMIALPPEVDTVAALRAWLAAREPQLAVALARPGVRAVVDDMIVGEQAAIDDSSDLAFIPPVSGG